MSRAERGHEQTTTFCRLPLLPAKTVREQSHVTLHTMSKIEPPGERRALWARVSGCLDGMKAAGIDVHPHNQSPEARAAGQAALMLFSINMLIVAIGHGGQLATDERFVYEPDAARPHASRTLRLVRILDFVVMLCWAVMMQLLNLALRTKRITPAQGHAAVLAAMACVVFVYLSGALADYAQCYFQAGGIGSHCHGQSCLRTAAATMVCLVVGRWRPHLFFLFCFGIQGALRLEWATRAEHPDVLRAIVVVFAITLMTLPAIAYSCDLAAALALSVLGRASTGKELDLELQRPASDGGVGSWLLRNVCGFDSGIWSQSSTDVGVAEKAQDVTKLAVECASDQCVCCEALFPEQPRAKEDDARLGGVSSPSSTDCNLEQPLSPSPLPVPSHEIPDCKSVRFCGAILKKENDQQKHDTKMKYMDRKRKRREELNSLVSALDGILPPEARRGGFKSAGPRSAGRAGRSAINVLTDAVEHLRLLDSCVQSQRPKNLADLRMTYRDGESHAHALKLLRMCAPSWFAVTSVR